MSDEIRINRAPQTQNQSAARMDMSPKEEMAEPRGGSKMPWIILAVVVVVLAVLGVLFRNKLFKPGQAMAEYQAVFLTNGQVYFGKLSDAGRDYGDLKDIYYLQVGPQQGSGTNAAGQAAQQSITLVKLGNELHGPVDEMHISRAQILFYEDLKSDGQVVKAINAYKANPSGAPAPAQQTPLPQAPAPTK